MVLGSRPLSVDLEDTFEVRLDARDHQAAGTLMVGLTKASPNDGHVKSMPDG